MKFKVGKTLAGKISLFTNIPFILVIVLMGVVTIIKLDHDLARQARINRQNIVNLSLEMVRNEVDGSVKSYLRAIAEKSREMMEYYYRKYRTGELSEAEALDKVRELMLDPEYGKIGTTGYLAGVTSGGVLAIHPLSEGVDASGHEFMQKAMALKNGYLEYAWKNKGEETERTKAGYLSWFEPWDIMVWASSYKEEFLSLMDRDQFKSLVESIRVGESGYIMLIDDKGEVIAGADAFLKYADTDDDQARSRLSAFSGEILNAEGDELFYPTGSGDVAASFAYIPELNWYLVVHDFTNEYMTIISSFRIIIVCTILFAGILVGLLVRALMNRVLSPMRAIKTVSDQVALGDLSGRIEITTGDEIGELGRFFNAVVDSFALLVENIQDASAVLLESTHSLGASTQEVSSTANQQAASVKEILSTMEDSDKLSQGVAVRIQEVVRVANHTRETVEKGFSLIQGSLGKMGEIKETNSRTIGGIKTLGNQIDSIWEIVNIINGIADQTKIIAFNAELEAAAAGEAGKNFQIVASEIRRLADSTVDSTNEIKGKINEIQHASDKLIIASEEGTQRIREGWEISDNIKGVFEEVLSSSEISAGSANDIAQAIKMQVGAFEQIFLTLKQISEGIDNFAVSTRATSEASDSLKEIADQFNESISQYSLGGEIGNE
jgi:methyl-accepting chemotaxis protein